MNYQALPKLNPDDPQVYARIDDDGLCRLTCVAEHPEFVAWLEEGNIPLPPEGSVRARNEDGTFKADDPATPGVNEAWVDGSSQ